MDDVRAYRRKMSTWLHNTPVQYVRILTVFYFLIKGVVATTLLFGSFPFYFYYHDVSGRQYQTYVTMGLLPWGCKSVIGILTDTYPIYGYHKRWYAYIAAALLPVWILGAVLGKTPDLTAVMLTGASSSLMTLDALMEVQYMSNVRFHDCDKGTASYTWQCTMAGSIIGPVIIGMCAREPRDAGNIRYAFASTIVLALPFVYMVLFRPATLFPNDQVKTALSEPMLAEVDDPLAEYHDDDVAKSLPKNHRRASSKSMRGPTLAEKTLAYLLLGGSISMFVLLFIDTPVYAFAGALIFTVLLLVVLNIAYRDEEGLRHTCIFGFLNEALHLDISGAVDTYFTTQNDNCVIGGPRFDFLFYITVAAVVSGLVGTFMSWLYRKHLIRKFEVRGTVVVALVAWGCTSVADIVIVKKWNESVLGVQAWVVFMFGDVVSSQAWSMVVLLPLMSLTSTAVIDGVAALTSMNTLSCQNIGSSVGRIFGLYLTHLFNVHATEARGCNFDYLVPLIIFARMIIPMYAVPLCYSLLPNAILEQRHHE